MTLLFRALDEWNYLIAAIVVFAGLLVYSLKPHPAARKRLVLAAVVLPLALAGAAYYSWLRYKDVDRGQDRSFYNAPQRDHKEVITLFEKGRFGSSPDWGLTKLSIVDLGRWDLIAVFYGSVADEENCQDAARALIMAGGQYTCMQLNK